jgi:hypothetical protein
VGFGEHPEEGCRVEEVQGVDDDAGCRQRKVHGMALWHDPPVGEDVSELALEHRGARAPARLACWLIERVVRELGLDVHRIPASQSEVRPRVVSAGASNGWHKGASITQQPQRRLTLTVAPAPIIGEFGGERHNNFDVQLFCALVKAPRVQSRPPHANWASVTHVRLS